jgi:hypothetical protein
MKLHLKVQRELHMKLTCAYARWTHIDQEIVGLTDNAMHDLFILVTFNIGSETGTCLGVESELINPFFFRSVYMLCKHMRQF